MDKTELESLLIFGNTSLKESAQRLGETAEKIVKKLKSINLDENLIKKVL
tara:strand:+ start:104 stop:253 length:150 start_codon:yes stop_codon:yes gene_type:complete